VSATQLDNLAGAWERLTGTVEAAQIDLFMRIRKPLTEFVNYAQKALEELFEVIGSAITRGQVWDTYKMAWELVFEYLSSKADQFGGKLELMIDKMLPKVMQQFDHANIALIPQLQDAFATRRKSIEEFSAGKEVTDSSFKGSELEATLQAAKAQGKLAEKVAEEFAFIDKETTRLAAELAKVPGAVREVSEREKQLADALAKRVQELKTPLLSERVASAGQKAGEWFTNTVEDSRKFLRDWEKKVDENRNASTRAAEEAKVRQEMRGRVAASMDTFAGAEDEEGGQWAMMDAQLVTLQKERDALEATRLILESEAKRASKVASFSEDTWRNIQDSIFQSEADKPLKDNTQALRDNAIATNALKDKIKAFESGMDD
jgi:hypothetical protein